jgi:hypothetical protein
MRSKATSFTSDSSDDDQRSANPLSGFALSWARTTNSMANRAVVKKGFLDDYARTKDSLKLLFRLGRCTRRFMLTLPCYPGIYRIRLGFFLDSPNSPSHTI